MYIIRIIEKLIVIYFALYFLIDIFLFIYSILIHRKSGKSTQASADYENHSISIIVPAFNEEVSIVDCIQMLAGVDYPDFEIIVVNDGSKDHTLQRMLEAFPFQKTDAHASGPIRTNTIKNVYADKDGKILLIDKENGGKADSINAGINCSAKKYICTIDADSILDHQALKKVIQPMIDSENTFVSGGFLATSNEIGFSRQQITRSRMPRNIWVLWQIVEYIKSFMISRLSLSKINMLLIMSGAFSVFRKHDLLNVGGFLSEFNDHPYIIKHLGKNKKTVCEDMEIVIRLWVYYIESKRKGRARFMADPVCWTEVPDNYKSLFKQRARWHQGLGESLRLYRHIIFEPRYRNIGLFAMPYYFMFEFLSPFIKVFSLLFLIVLSAFNIIHAEWMLLLLISVLLITTLIMSIITVLIEAKSKGEMAGNKITLRYNTFGDWLWLLFTSVIGSFSYEFFKMAAQLKGIINIIQHKNEWNKFARKGLKSNAR